MVGIIKQAMNAGRRMRGHFGEAADYLFNQTAENFERSQMDGKPWNTIDPNDLVAVVRQWAEWRDALKGVDPVKLMPLVERLVRAANASEVYAIRNEIIDLFPKSETP